MVNKRLEDRPVRPAPWIARPKRCRRPNKLRNPTVHVVRAQAQKDDLIVRTLGGILARNRSYTIRNVPMDCSCDVIERANGDIHPRVVPQAAARPMRGGRCRV